MSRPLSYRRAQENRALHKAFRIVREWYPRESFHRGGIYGMTRRVFTPEDRWDMARHIAGNRKICSCGSCGNPRNKGWDTKGTIQERKALEDYYSQLEDLLR